MITKSQISSDYFKTLEVSIHAGCSVGCDYCPQELYQRNYFSKDFSPRNMKKSDYEVVLKNTLGSSIEKILFAGYSENFLNPRATEFIITTFNAGFRIGLITTAIGLTKKDIYSLAKVPLERCTISLNPNHFEYDIKKRNNLLRTIECVFDNLPNSQAIIVAQKSQRTSNKINNLVSFCETHEVSYRFDWHDRAGNLLTKPSTHNPEIQGHYYCTRPLTNVLQPNGDLSLCCMDWSLNHVIGNLLENSYTDIIDRKPMTEILTNLYNGHINNQLCKHCHYLEKVTKDWKSISERRKQLYNKDEAHT
jgi:radical SAM protein with 4Fe4S-binding SPASM domain